MITLGKKSELLFGGATLGAGVLSRLDDVWVLHIGIYNAKGKWEWMMV